MRPGTETPSPRDLAAAPTPTPTERLLLRARHVHPHRLNHLLAESLEQLGLELRQVYLVDLRQRLLLPFDPPTTPPHADREDGLDVEDSEPGRCFREDVPVVREHDGATTTWLPLRLGHQRTGVVEVRGAVQDDDAAAGLVAAFGQVLAATGPVNDEVLAGRRTSTLALAAEIQWALLPPLTWVGDRFSVALVLEPAYDVAGDGVDYALESDSLSFAILDGMGHGLTSARMTALALNAYRNARRAGRDLAEVVRTVDDVLRSLHPDDFSTGVIGRLDLATGELAWVDVAHPDPLLFRHDRLVGPLRSEHSSPFGMGGLPDLEREEGWPTVSHHRLEPGDMVLLHTDGVVEARSPEGEEFGEERLAGLICDHLGSNRGAGETLRRVAVDLERHQGARFHDDATMMLLQWHPDHRAEPGGPDAG